MADARIDTIAALEALYGKPGAAATVKVARRLTPLYRRWIMASRFCILSTVGPEGTDASPRGDTGPVVVERDPGTLLLPDWRGNNRLDSLRNIVVDGRVSLLFMVPGNTNVVRINGCAWLTADADVRAGFERYGKRPATVVVIEIGEIYTQCARALIRSGLWEAAGRAVDLPTVGDILAEMTQGTMDGAAYDAEWPARAARTMW